MMNIKDEIIKEYQIDEAPREISENISIQNDDVLVKDESIALVNKNPVLERIKQLINKIKNFFKK